LQQSFTRDKELFLKLKDISFPAFTHLLPRITAPTLVIAGDRLKFEQKGAQILYEQIPNAQLAIFADAFDPVSTMRKDIFNQLVLDFLADQPLTSYPNVTYSNVRRANHTSNPLQSSY
jgi:pimeloyl-ACP methyl ester carboxylesterase